MNVDTDTALSYLQEQLQPLDERAAAIEQELAGIKDARKRYRAAIKALEAGKAEAEGTSTPKRPCCKKSQAIEIMETFLIDNGPLETDILKELAMEKIAETMSKSGAALRLKEALTDDRFHINAEGRVSLTQNLDDLNITEPSEPALAAIL